MTNILIVLTYHIYISKELNKISNNFTMIDTSIIYNKDLTNFCNKLLINDNKWITSTVLEASEYKYKNQLFLSKTQIEKDYIIREYFEPEAYNKKQYLITNKYSKINKNQVVCYSY